MTNQTQIIFNFRKILLKYFFLFSQKLELKYFFCRNAQEALQATRILSQELTNIRFTWLTAKPKFDQKDVSTVT